MNMNCCDKIDYWVAFVWDWVESAWNWMELVRDLTVCIAVTLAVCVTVILIVLWLVVLVLWGGNGRTVCIPTPLQTKRCPDGKRELLKDLKVEIVEGGKKIPIEVAKGFTTDFSSIPYGLRWTMHWSRVDVAGVVHDSLYRDNAAKPADTGMKRSETDRIWWDIALSGERHANSLQASAGWLGLRIYGWRVWNHYKK